MNLSEIFDHLAYGELSQLAVTTGLDGEREISVADRLKLVAHINLGLTELHKRFFLKEGSHVVYLSPGLLDYSVYADDLLKIEKILDAEGNELDLNQGNRDRGAVTTTYNSFRLGKEVTGGQVTVIYRADHGTISPRDAERCSKRAVVNLPRTHLEALLYFIASRIVNPSGFETQGMHEGNNYYTKFERACQVIENGGYKITQQEEKPRIQRMGWV